MVERDETAAGEWPLLPGRRPGSRPPSGDELSLASDSLTVRYGITGATGITFGRNLVITIWLDRFERLADRFEDERTDFRYPLAVRWVVLPELR